MELRRASRRDSLAALAAGVMAALILAGTAAAQDPASPMRFWLNETAAAPTAPSPPPPRTRRSSQAVSRIAALPRPPVEAPSFIVAVFGDALAYDVARGLDDAYSGNPKAGVYDATADDQGLAETLLPAWAASIDKAAADAGHIDAAVLMVGTADLRPLADDHGGIQQPGTDAWRQVYGERIEQLAAAFRSRHIALVWVGLPVVADAGLASRYADLNAVLREHVPKGGATFIDAWEAFTDDGGQYSVTGPDIDGQTTRLRRSDGLRFTRAGARKLASFAEPDLKREQDRVESSRRLAAVNTDDRSLFDQALAIDVNAQIRREAGLAPLTLGGTNDVTVRPREEPVVLLTAPPLSPDGRLASLTEPQERASSAEAALARGLLPPARHGRIDDFTWPRQ